MKKPLDNKTFFTYIVEKQRQKNLHLWDIAAGLIIVEEAGGIINKIDLNNHKDLKIIASSPDINEKLREKINIF